jgi:hypothetical protein
MSLRWIQGLLVLLAFFSLGCGSNQPKPVPVHGMILGRNGQSIGPVIIIFWPHDSKNNRIASTTSEADGSFHLECPPGKYKVTVSPIRPKGATSPPSPQESGGTIPPRYQNEVTTTLNVTISESGEENIILNLKRD